MEETAAPPPSGRPSAKFVIAVLVLMIAAFLIGFIPERLTARRAQADLQRIDLDLRLATLHRDLGVAAVEAGRNNYAAATSAATRFFEGCRTTSELEAFASEQRTRTALTGYAMQKDQYLGELANADPAVKDHLAQLYLTMDGVLHRRP